MSSASTTRTIKFISKAGTYMATIMCPDGDLFQYWDGTGVDQTVFPNFETMKPKLNFICTSSRVAEGIANIASMRYYFGGAEITFNSSGYSTGLFGDGTAEGSYFKRYAADGSTFLYPGLQILKNIAAIASYLPVTIKMVATIYYGTQEDSISADYTIPIQQKAQFAGKVTIVAGDNKSFVISSKGDSCILQAKAYNSEGALSVGLTYTWEQFDPSAVGNVDGWKLLGDVQGVIDKSDPYDIDPHPSPEDETIDEDTSSSRDHVTYTPVLVTRGGAAVSPNPLYYFLVRDAAGVVLNKYRDGNAAVNGSDPMELSTNAMASYTVTREQCQAGGGDISITIQAAS